MADQTTVEPIYEYIRGIGWTAQSGLQTLEVDGSELKVGDLVLAYRLEYQNFWNYWDNDPEQGITLERIIKRGENWLEGWPNLGRLLGYKWLVKR